MTIHKEGYTSIALCILLIFVLNAFLQFYFPGATAFKWIVYILSFLFFVGTLWFFRDPGVDVVTDENVILSPADGKVVSIEEVEESEFLKDRRLKISIAISRTDVHSNRNPVSGVVTYAAVPGKARNTIAVESSAGTTILYRQIAGISKRVISYLKQGDTAVQGEQFGFSMLGSKVEVFLPLNAKTTVDIDDVVKAGQTVLAQLK